MNSSSPQERTRPRQRWREALRVGIALLPVLMLSIAVPFVNRIDPRIFGLPFVLAWILAWVLATPAALLLVHRLERRP